MGFEYGPFRVGEQPINAEDGIPIEDLLSIYAGLCAIHGLECLKRGNPAVELRVMIEEVYAALAERVAWLEQGGEK